MMRLSLLLLTLISLLATLGKAQRSIILTNCFGTGTRNVKYETIANNVIDNDGKIIPQKSNAYGCVDYMGRVRQDGEEYERQNGKFKYRCNNGIETIIACIGSDRTAKALIKVGDTFIKDGFWHKCTHHANNETAIYTEENACNVNDKLYHINDEIRCGFILMKCSENGLKIIGCYYIDENKMEIDMKPGTTIEMDGTMHYCDDKNDSIRYYTKIVGCMKYGKKYKEGEQFAKNHLRYECKNGMVDVIGCYMDEIGRNIEINDSIIDKNMVYSCYIENDLVKYEQYPCGFRGLPSCEVLQKQKISIKVPTVPKPNPGFGAFSIVQHINQGGDKIAIGSNAMKFELVKLVPRVS